jgi:hypothetical protein
LECPRLVQNRRRRRWLGGVNAVANLWLLDRANVESSSSTYRTYYATDAGRRVQQRPELDADWRLPADDLRYSPEAGPRRRRVGATLPGPPTGCIEA